MFSVEMVLEVEQTAKQMCVIQETAGNGEGPLWRLLAYILQEAEGWQPWKPALKTTANAQHHEEYQVQPTE